MTDPEDNDELELAKLTYVMLAIAALPCVASLILGLLL